LSSVLTAADIAPGVRGVGVGAVDGSGR